MPPVGPQRKYIPTLFSLSGATLSLSGLSRAFLKDISISVQGADLVLYWEQYRGLVFTRSFWRVVANHKKAGKILLWILYSACRYLKLIYRGGCPGTYCSGAFFLSARVLRRRLLTPPLRLECPGRFSSSQFPALCQRLIMRIDCFYIFYISRNWQKALLYPHIQFTADYEVRFYKHVKRVVLPRLRLNSQRVLRRNRRALFQLP